MRCRDVLGTASPREQVNASVGLPPDGRSLSPREGRAEGPPWRGSVESCSDGELIRRVGDGDRAAFEAVYQRFARPVLGLSLRRLRDRGRAEDATEEAFAAVWRSAASYEPERGPGALWLYAVASTAIDNQAHRRLEPASELPASDSEAHGALEQAESDSVRWRVHRALEELPEHQRVLIQLAYWSALSQAEIATRLNIPPGTVRTRTSSALTHRGELLEH
jgi:RNA polymerase sigma-70 factor, ECF subfamily